MSKIFKGHVRIDLCDPITGKVLERSEGDNFFTNAISSVYNGCPYGMDSRVTNPNNIVPASQMPLYDTSLAGVILWPNSLGEGENDFFPNLDTDYPTGYASKEAYVVSDPKQGSFNAVESGPLPNNAGYKYVYDFAPSQANGQIACVSLSHKNCYKYFNDGSKAFIPPANLVETGYRTVIGANSDGIYFNGGHDSFDAFPQTPYIYKFSRKQRKLGLLYDQSNILNSLERVFTSWQYDQYGYFNIDENYLYYIKVTTSAATSTFEMTTIDFATETVSTQSYTVAAYLSSNSNSSRGDKFAKRGNYVYIPGNDPSKVYKINLTNVADVTELTIPTGASAFSQGCCNFGDLIIGYGFTIDEADTVRSLALDSQNRSPLMFNRDGVWGVYALPLSYRFGIGICANYAATKYDLDNPLQKTAAKSAKVTYIVTQQ